MGSLCSFVVKRVRHKDSSAQSFASRQRLVDTVLQFNKSCFDVCQFFVGFCVTWFVVVRVRVLPVVPVVTVVTVVRVVLGMLG